MANGEEVKGVEAAGWRELAGGQGMLRLESAVASSVPGMVERFCRRLGKPARQLSLPPISVIR